MSDIQKAKFNRKRCKSCMYHGVTTGGGNYIFCDYAGKTGETCLKREGKVARDIRGDDYDNCQIYEKGRAVVKSDNNYDLIKE